MGRAIRRVSLKKLLFAIPLVILIVMMFFGAGYLFKAFDPSVVSPGATSSTVPQVAAVTQTRCPYIWAYDYSPKHAAQFTSRLQAAGLQNFTVFNVVAYGERSCDTFSPMSYDIELSVKDPTVIDMEGLGKLAVKVLNLLGGVRQLQLTLEGNGISFGNSFNNDEAQALVAKGLTGAALIDALKQLR